MNYILMTDSDSDLPLGLQKEWNIPFVKMPYTVDGQEYFDDLGETVSSVDFFNKMRAGASVKTSALNTENYLELLEPVLAENDILFIAFSSAMSSTHKAMAEARDILLKKYPQRTFRIVDTLSISAPMTCLLWKAHQMYAAGESLQTVAEWVEKNRLRAQAFFTVDDLEYLRRGGRITGTVAVVGKLLDLKPILIENRDGLIASLQNIRGRRHALNFIVEKALQNHPGYQDIPCIIVHADAEKDAYTLKEMLESRAPGLLTRVENIGPVIGAHCGPGTVALCFIGDERAQ